MIRWACVGAALLLGGCGGRTILTGVETGEESGGTGSGESSGATRSGASGGTRSSSGPSTGGGSSACESLGACCAELPTEAAIMECQLAVAANNAGDCSADLDTAQSAGFCDFGSGGSSSGGFGESSTGGATGSGGFSGSRGASSGTSCQTLLACCMSLPSTAIATCEATTVAGNDQSCAETLNEIVEQGFCQTNGGSGSGTGGG